MTRTASVEINDTVPRDALTRVLSQQFTFEVSIVEQSRIVHKYLHRPGGVFGDAIVVISHICSGTGTCDLLRIQSLGCGDIHDYAALWQHLRLILAKAYNLSRHPT